MNISPEILNYYMQYYSVWAGLPPYTLQLIAMIESSYNPNTGYFRNVCNSVKACGLMQLKPIALADLKRIYKIDFDPMNPIMAIVGAAGMMRINRVYLRHAGIEPDFWAMLAAYNGGWTMGRNYMRGQQIGNEQRNYLAKAYNIIRAA